MEIASQATRQVKRQKQEQANVRVILMRVIREYVIVGGIGIGMFVGFICLPNNPHRAAERNKQPILDVLKSYINDGTYLLEIASGSGQHVAHFARHFANVTFQPTEHHSSLINSILAYKDHFNLQNVLPAEYLNVEDDAENWLTGNLNPESVDYIYNSNMIHITRYSCTEGLFRGCGRYLKPGGLVFLYGPFAYNGLITPSSNVEFDKGLKSSDPSYGLRDVIRQLVPEASKYRIRLETQHQLPSNNQLLVWKKY